MLTKARAATAAAALFAVIGVIAVARAEPLTIRIGWVVTPGNMAPAIEALGKHEPTMLKHLGDSDVLQPLRFNGE
jgi:ABC-type nitrate/sulfonate/bicarbonate transport system substrate-binding protein